MDEFVGFNYLLVDASTPEANVVEQCHQRERVDVIARQFRDFLKRHEVAEDQPRGMVMTHDFKVRGQATRAAGWLSFHVARGDGAQTERVALVAFAREDGEDVGRVLERETPGLPKRQLPPVPFAVAVLTAESVPSVVAEFLTKAAAGFFSKEF